jgi:hypothetical protein
MTAAARGRLSNDLLRAQQRFQAWRKGRPKTGRRIPPSLWRLAVQLVRSHGISRTATVLGLDYYSLKKQAEAATRRQPSPSTPAFVELSSSIGLGKQCRLELDNGAGAHLRVQLTGYDAADLEVLARCFGSVS